VGIRGLWGVESRKRLGSMEQEIGNTHKNKIKDIFD
jgi:hypothetical protein